MPEVENKKQIVIPQNFLEVAKELQYVLAVEEDEQKQIMLAADAIEIMGDPRDYFGSNKLFIHALGAYAINDNNSFSSVYWHNLILNDVLLKARFSRVAFVQKGNFKSLCLHLFDSEVVNNSDEGYNGLNIRSGMFAPVLQIESVWAAE